jgi:hypothetical protein
MTRSVIVLALCCACALSLLDDIATADVFKPIELVSARPVQLTSGTLSEQAERATESVVSADGRYVAFVGSFGGVSGIWRRNLETGAVEQVAPGGAFAQSDARLPSISEEGRYVSFTTTARLAPEDDPNKAPDVYVRDMDKPCQTQGGACVACAEHQDAAELEGCPFVLVSAVEDSSEGATYEYAQPTEEQSFGSLASGRSAMSADGRYVVFETAAESNLLGGPTPPREILVRDLETDETRLVSSEYDPQTGTDTGVPVPMGERVGAAYPVLAFRDAQFGGASISADGSTVAWLGQEIGRQVQLLPGEQAAYPPTFDEPLWRRIAGGASAPTRRVTGGSEPENPLCVASGESVLGPEPNPLDPCQGPFAPYNREDVNYVLAASAPLNYVPQLSENGETVAFLASAPVVGSGAQLFGNETSSDVYVSEMSGSLTRVQALRRLTETGTDAANAQQAASIVDLAISPDADQVAFTTRRTDFPLGSPTYVSTTAPQAGIEELFDADLASDTLTRVTHGFTGETIPSERSASDEEGDGAASPSFSKSGNVLSFSSSADNLVYGDGNDASDAFLVDRVVFTGSTPQQYVSGVPAPPAVMPAWRLYAVAEPKASGTVVLYATVPGPGHLSVGATATVPVTFTVTRAARARARAHRAQARRALSTRSVASAAANVPATGGDMQELTLTLAPSYRALAQRAGGLYAAITLRFTAPGHPALSTSLHISFRRTTPAHHARSAHKAGQSKRRRR